MNVKTATCLLIVAAGAVSTAAKGQNRDYPDGGYGRRGGRPGATFFVKDSFEGRQVFVDRPVRSMREFDLNDKISSIDVAGGRWLVCVDDDFRGRCQVIDHSIKHLSNIGMDDKISSARPLYRDDDR